jgi:hypothetical protein
VKQLERRVTKLECATVTSTNTEDDREIAVLVEFLSSPEVTELIHLLSEPGNEAAAEEIKQRSAIRREQYPVAWWAWPVGRSHPVIAEPWTPEREIEALRNEIAINWERCGLSLILDSLTPMELGLVDRLRAPGAVAMRGTWGRVQHLIATPDDIPIGKVFFYARAASKEIDAFGNPLTWEDVSRPLTWADLKLDPAAFSRRH